MESTHHYTKAVTIKSYIVFLILILYTPSLYCIPPPYQRLLWNYKKADISDIQKALQLVNLDRLLDDKNVDSQVLLLNDIILNIFRNFVPNRYVTCDDKDPFWMNEKIKSKIKVKNKFNQVYFKKGKQETDFCVLEESVRNLNDLISANQNILLRKSGEEP